MAVGQCDMRFKRLEARCGWRLYHTKEQAEGLRGLSEAKKSGCGDGRQTMEALSR